MKPILMQSCSGCHSHGVGIGLAPLTAYAEAAEYTKVDLGKSVQVLARVSHVPRPARMVDPFHRA